MKYYKRLKVFKSSNLEYNPLTNQSYSYDHWQFTREVKGKIFFNATMYSVTTSRHQSKVRSQLNKTFKGDKVLYFRLRDSRTNMKYLNDSELVARIISDYNKDIQDLLDYNAKPRIRTKTKEANLERIEGIKKDIAELAQFEAASCFDNQLETMLEGRAL